MGKAFPRIRVPPEGLPTAHQGNQNRAFIDMPGTPLTHSHWKKFYSELGLLTGAWRGRLMGEGEGEGFQGWAGQCLHSLAFLLVQPVSCHF